MATHTHTRKDGRSSNRIPARKGERIVLDSGESSPVLNRRLLGVHGAHSLSSLSYDALLGLNRALSAARTDAQEAAGGAYGHHEHFKWLYILSKHGKGRVFESLLPWVEVNARQVRHRASFFRALEYCIFLNLADHTLTVDELRELTGTQSLFITMSQMKKAELIGTSGKANGVVTFALTEKGKTLVRLACDSMERQENTLRSILFKNPS